MSKAHRVETLRLSGCREHNLKNLSLSIPKHCLVVITGVSGSGKSSLAFDTIYAEGQRRYLEYLSPEIRRWIKQMPKPDLDLIEGLSPTLAVGQHRTAFHPRSTVATHTDIYDFLTVLFAAIGEQYSPVTGKRLTRYTRQQMVEAILSDYAPDARIQILAPVHLTHESIEEAVMRLQKQGFIRIHIDGHEVDLQQPLPTSVHSLDVVVDRLVMKEGIRDRLSESINTALDLSGGILKLQEGTTPSFRYYTEVFLCPESGVSFPALQPRDFNFYSPRAACPTCHGMDLACPTCKGGLLKAESLACRIQGKNIHDMTLLSVEGLLSELKQWNLPPNEAVIAQEILPEVISRLEFLEEVGLGYLELNRQASTLSEGEQQRLQLASQIGAKLSGILYVLDEPSRGLHPHDLTHLQSILKRLRALGNTLIVVEHEKNIITSADHIIELGKGAGIHGGSITYQGDIKGLVDNSKSVSGRWLAGKDDIPIPSKRRKGDGFLKVSGITCHNLRDFSVDVPLGMLVGLCGVSGSGKSSLAIDVIATSIQEMLQGERGGYVIQGAENVQRLVMIGQHAPGATNRSIPATYIDIMTPLRRLFAETKLAKSRGYTAARFTLNRKGGRCEACEGQGFQRVDLMLMPDLLIPCDLCRGKRYNYETLQVTWDNYSIADVLDMSAEKAYQVFKHMPAINDKLLLMQELGLEYLSLGQHASTLSGGEMQRLKLVADIALKQTLPTLYIMDEPSAGLHHHDVKKLVKILHRLVDAGHSIIMVEHNIDLLAQADWLMELGPGAGPHGGTLIFEGTVEQLKRANTPTAHAF